ncbi:MAG TPA: spermidine/putrescine ABC transporter substrate-binding protein [Anaerolinea sp.]|nr:spermidine/putrescine ABC transporter substrate-binding protein [Anaerolinea sp.]
MRHLFRPPYLFILSLAIFLLISTTCQPAPQTTSLPPELVFRTWEDDLPPDLLDGFTKETGIPVRLLSYEAQEDAVADIEAQKPGDVVVMDARFIPGLVTKKALARFDRSNLPNFRYISVAFRDLSFDPGNLYTVPYQWGTAGIVYRRDLTGRDITRWADLWDPAYAGKVGIWRGQIRETTGLTLKMLGYSANTENPEEIAAAMRKLADLRHGVVWIESIDPYTSVPGLLDDRLALALGYAFDEVEGKSKNPQIKFVLPAEGAVLWSEHFIIPAHSRYQAEAERLVNYLLEPYVMAEIVNYNHYAPAHDGAIALLPSDIRTDPLIFPSDDVLANAEIIFPVSDSTEQLYQSSWEDFIAGIEKESP